MLWRSRVLPVPAQFKDLFHISKNLNKAINQKTLLNQSCDLFLHYFTSAFKKTKKPHQTQDCIDYLQTFSELGHIVVCWLAQMDEEIREIATNSNGKDECGTYPKGTLKGNKQVQ